MAPQNRLFTLYQLKTPTHYVQVEPLLPMVIRLTFKPWSFSSLIRFSVSLSILALYPPHRPRSPVMETTVTVLTGRSCRGGWVGGLIEEVEEIKAVRMRCCGLLGDGWLGGRGKAAVPSHGDDGHGLDGTVL